MKNLKAVVYLLLIDVVLCASILAQEKDSLADRVEKLYYQAGQFHNTGELQQALKLYTKVLELDATHADSYWYRSLIYGQQEK